MKIMILNTIIEKLKLTPSRNMSLFGLTGKEVVVVTALDTKEGLKKVGSFSHNATKTEDNSLVFFFKKEKLVCTKFLKNGKTKELEVEVINYTTDFNSRNHGIVDESVLQERTITIIGLGSGGSAIACDLVRCGVTKLNLVEFDTVSVSNICRSVYDLTDVGKKKTEALHQKLLKINPLINIQLHDKNVLEMEHSDLMQIINGSDLIIEATDSTQTKVLINGLAHQKTVVLYPAVYEMGKGGDILFTIPGSPCYECCFKSILSQNNEVREGDWDYSTDQAKPMPALISDIQVIVARTVKIALAILTSDQKDSFLEKVIEPECSILFIGNEKDVFVFDKPFQELWAKVTVEPDCSCQTLG